MIGICSITAAAFVTQTALLLILWKRIAKTPEGHRCPLFEKDTRPPKARRGKLRLIRENWCAKRIAKEIDKHEKVLGS